MTGPAFQPWLDRWGLVPDGEAFSTPSTGSWLLPVRRARAPAMLKLAMAAEEVAGGALMEWWGGQGAAPVLARQDEALLLERAMGEASLAQMAAGGQDDAATLIICAAVERLHRPRAEPPPSTLVHLAAWFEALAAVAGQGVVLAKAYAVSLQLLREPRDVVVLHGDVHHGNILDFGAAGWLAIDPKGLIGDRGYDYANSLRNPDLATAAASGRLARQATLASKAAGLDRERLLQWVLAHAGLSAAWTILGGGDPTWSMTIAEIAAAELSL